MVYLLDPQVAGELGEGTVFEDGSTRPQLLAVDYVLDAPDPDELIQSYPAYLASEKLAETMSAAGLSGFEFAAATVRPGVEYRAVYGDLPYDRYRWLKVIGAAGIDDCWLATDGRLCTSERMLAVLKSARLSNCIVETL